jgi:hypothetical protein
MMSTLGESSALAAIVPFGEAKDASYARLSGEFSHSGFRLSQLKRVGDVAIYKQTKGKQPSAYEVVVIRRREACVAVGTELPATEVYPPNEAWGSNGFTYRTLEEAERKFMELAGQEQEVTQV